MYKMRNFLHQSFAFYTCSLSHFALSHFITSLQTAGGDDGVAGVVSAVFLQTGT